MFRSTDPQVSLLECQFLLPPEKRARLEASWAEPFQKLILPLIDEEVMRKAFSADNGRPNTSIRLLVGLHLLKEWHDLTDEQVLEGFEFNLQWHYALAVEPSAAHLCQKTLHNFREKLMESDRAQKMFERLTLGLAQTDGLDLGRQRLDSTHVISNIAVLTRLGLFVETVAHFLQELRRRAPAKLAELDAGYATRYLDREGYFADAKREQARRRLPMVADDIYRLVQRFEQDEEISAWESYRLLVRLFEEQCEVVQGGEQDDGRVALPRPSPDAVEPESSAAEALGKPESRLSQDEEDGAGPASGEKGAGQDASRAPKSDGDGAPPALPMGHPDGAGEASPSPLAAGPHSDPAACPSDDDPADSASQAHSDPVACPPGDDPASSAAQAHSEPAACPSDDDPADSASQAHSDPADCPPGDDSAGSGTQAHSDPAASVPGDDSAGNGGQEDDSPQLRLKQGKEVGSDSLQSPYDPDATYGKKGKGYEAQVAETCSDDNPYQLITGVEINGAHESDQRAVIPMLDQLESGGMKPTVMLADTGYGSGKNIVQSAQKGVDLQAPVQDPDARNSPDPWIGPIESEGSPTSPPTAGQPGAGEIVLLGLEVFVFSTLFDRILACPAGHPPTEQHLGNDDSIIYATFGGQLCANCPLAELCPMQKNKSGQRTLRCGTAQAATALRQAVQQTDEFKDPYKKRSGIESTNSEIKGPHGADDLRVRGKKKVSTAMKLKAMALNAKRALRHHVGRLKADLRRAHAAAA